MTVSVHVLSRTETRNKIENSSILLLPFTRKASLKWSRTIGVNDPDENFSMLASFVRGEYLKYLLFRPSKGRGSADGRKGIKENAKLAYHRVKTFFPSSSLASFLLAFYFKNKLSLKGGETRVGAERCFQLRKGVFSRNELRNGVAEIITFFGVSRNVRGLLF